MKQKQEKASYITAWTIIVSLENAKQYKKCVKIKKEKQTKLNQLFFQFPKKKNLIIVEDTKRTKIKKKD